MKSVFLRGPITRAIFKREFAWLWERGDFDRSQTYEIVFDLELTQSNTLNRRDFAFMEMGNPANFYFAEQILKLPVQYRLGLIAHEIGHLIGGARQSSADKAAKDYLGIHIKYDKLHFPGKGLEYAYTVDGEPTTAW